MLGGGSFVTSVSSCDGGLVKAARCDPKEAGGAVPL